MVEPRRSPSSPVQAGGARFLVVEALFYEDVGAMLRAGATAAFEQAGAACEVLSVPGALELPVALAIALDRTALDGTALDGCRYAGAVALGCVIRGETYHFEVVCNESARALTALAVAARLPFGNGGRTVETGEPALERAEPRRGDKGGDAARAALALWSLADGRLKAGSAL